MLRTPNPDSDRPDAALRNAVVRGIHQLEGEPVPVVVHPVLQLLYVLAVVFRYEARHVFEEDHRRLGLVNQPQERLEELVPRLVLRPGFGIPEGAEVLARRAADDGIHIAVVKAEVIEYVSIAHHCEVLSPGSQQEVGVVDFASLLVDIDCAHDFKVLGGFNSERSPTGAGE